MKLGEKLQKLRKRSGLSQEQLAARLTVSRQAVSKWELDETVPDTENVVQLSRLFGVSCDYLLREEADDPGAVPPPQDALQPAAPGETHLDGRGWIHNAFVLSLGVCAVGMVLVVSNWMMFDARSVLVGFAIQIIGLVMFELATPRMGEERAAARQKFYAIACWMVTPVPAMGLYQVLVYNAGVRKILGSTRERERICYIIAYLLLSGIAALLLYLQRRRAARKN